MSPELNFQVVPIAQVPANELIANVNRQLPVVLVVDDERVIADTLSVILSRSGFTAMSAYDAESALELAGIVPPNLLLSDVVMGPGMDGTELAIKMVKAFPNCKVLLFSGQASTADLLDKAREGGHDFTLLTKPLHPADLLARISESFAGAEVCAATA
jgi:DNA-binding response OmpR family regulator